jgi:hypothetical protein
MKNVLPIILACIIGPALGTKCGAQEMPKLHLRESPSPEVVFVPFSESQFPAFATLFANKRTAGLQRAAFVLSNQSDRAIIGIAARWTVLGQDGSTVHFKASSHMYLSVPPSPLAPPSGRMLIAPETFAPESLFASGGGIIGIAPDPAIASKLTGGSQIYAEVDCIIFGDGEVVGLDRSRLVAEIQDQKGAIDVVLNRVHAAQANGENVSDVLSQLATSPVSAHDSVGRRTARLAGELFQTRHREASLSLIEAIPAPVNFYRKDGGPIR